MQTNGMQENKDIDLEDLIRITEQKITDNEYYEDVTVKYRDLNVHLRIQPISQAKFTQLANKSRGKINAELSTLLIQECVINKHNNTHFTVEQINQLFSGGLATRIARKCMEISGIPIDEEANQNNKNF